MSRFTKFINTPALLLTSIFFVGCGGESYDQVNKDDSFIPVNAEYFVIFAPYRSVDEFTSLGLGERTATELARVSNIGEDYTIATVAESGAIESIETLRMRPVDDGATPAVIIFSAPPGNK